jgi:hypothetical protein
MSIITLLITATVAGAKEETIVALPGHELGDSTFSIGIGVYFPMFLQDLNGSFYSANSYIGGTGSIQWSAYLNDAVRLGIEVQGAFSYDPNMDLYWTVPITLKAAYMFSFSRFEVPVYFATGINLFMYRELFDMLFTIKPGVGFFWRFDANLSFGINVNWWWNLEFPTTLNGAPKSPGMMANFLDISPALYYYF